MDETGLPPPPSPSPTPGAPRPSNTRRIVIIIGVLLGAALLFCLGVGAFAVWGLKKSGADKVLSSAMDSQKGPGPEALRARGCQTAMALDLRDIIPGQAPQVDIGGIQVVCTLAKDADLTCPDGAKVYADAAGPAMTFMLVVTDSRGKERCSGLFGPTGEPADELPADDATEPSDDQLDMGGDEPGDEPVPPAPGE